MSGPHSGKHGVIAYGPTPTAITYMRNWTLNDSQTPETYFASNTKGGQFAQPGVNDLTGTFETFGGGFQTGSPIFPGEVFDLWMYSAPDDDVYGNDGKVYKCGAIVDSVTINWNWEAGQSLGASYNWSGAKSVALGDGLTIEDGEFDDDNCTIPEKMCGLKVETGPDDDIDPGTYTEWDHLVSAALTITSDNQPYVNSSTSCYTHRKPGNISWTLALTEQDTHEKFPKGTRRRIRLYIDDTKFWLLEFGLIVDNDGPTVNRESGEIISKTVNWIMTGSNDSVCGTITDPDSTVQWPKTPTP